ncbi:hypothetical protein MKX01_007046 [Papaver californicum]|nr:hypothetical protein MKX01_007046 [Papaver californicum]
MSREGHIVIPNDTLMKKIAAAASSRRWILLDSSGEATVLDVDSHSIMQRVEIHARDLHMLDPLTSTILAREKAILFNLDLTDNDDNFVIPMSPFEFRALEIALKAICSFLDARTTELETIQAYTRSLDCVHKLKCEMTRLIARVQRVIDELKKLLDDDGDMAELYLSRKMASSSSPISSVSGAPNGFPASAFKVSKASREIAEGDENDVKELEMLFESYFVQVDHTLNKLGTFGMNIPFKWNQPHYGFMFKWVVILPVVVCASVFVLIISYMPAAATRVLMSQS